MIQGTAGRWASTSPLPPILNHRPSCPEADLIEPILKRGKTRSESRQPGNELKGVLTRQENGSFFGNVFLSNHRERHKTHINVP